MLHLLAFALALVASPPRSPAINAVYAPLWLYNGFWRISKSGQPAGSKPDELLNQCALVGKYFTCQQSVNGTPSELLVFLPATTPGEYHTQSIYPDGRAGGRGSLSISGNTWVYSSNWDQGGKTTFYRTTNTFTGDTRIHYEQQESSDQKDWKTTGSGDEVRVSPGRTTIVR